jgi:hemolysin activation/secretion protein
VAGLLIVLSGVTQVALAQTPPAPSQVAPPTIAAPPPTAHITLPQVPAGAEAPAQAKKLFFVLTGLDVVGEFPELADERTQLANPLIGKRISVADLFELANKLQQAYVRAGYPLARVVTLPQEIGKSARVKLQVIDGFVERFDLTALPEQVRGRVALILAPLLHKTHLTQNELERRLLIAGETPGLILNATFGAGKEIGGSLLVLTGRYRPLSATLYVDNAMPKSFRTWQAATSVSLNNIAGLGEQLTVNAAGYPDRTFTTGLPIRRYLGATLSLPIGIDGFRFEAGGTNGWTTPVTTPGTETQGRFDQSYAKLFYEAVKLRDAELTFNARFDATDERITSLAVTPSVPLSQDRIRALRGGLDGILQLREVGMTWTWGLTVSRGLNVFGARTAADANPLLPLSRLGADAIFSKAEGHVEVYTSLPERFFISFATAGQTSFNRPLLTSEQFDITGAKALSGFTAGALPGDTAWVVRGEFGNAIFIPIENGGVTFTPYIFAATGERILEMPTVLEIGDIHPHDYGAGVRFNLAPWNDAMLESYAFAEWSRRKVAADPRLDGDRIFAGILLRY